MDDFLEKLVSELTGSEVKILDEFAKAIICSQTLQGKHLINVVESFVLNVQKDFSDGICTTKYWFTLKDDDDNSV